MDEPWRQSLRRLQEQFQSGARKYPGLRCTLWSSAGDTWSYENRIEHWLLHSDGGLKRFLWQVTPLTNNHNVWNDHYFWWEICFYPSVMGEVVNRQSVPPPQIPDWAAEEFRLAAKGANEFAWAADAASHILCTGRGWESLPSGVREELLPVRPSGDAPELWIATLFYLAWQCPDGSQLRAQRLAPEPLGESLFARGGLDSPLDLVMLHLAEESSKSYVSPLPIDPFSASVAAIDVLLDGAKPPVPVVFHGDGLYMAGDTPIRLDGNAAFVLQALVDLRAATKSQLERHSGVEKAVSILRSIKKQQPLLGQHIEMPGKKGGRLQDYHRSAPKLTPALSSHYLATIWPRPAITPAP